MFAVDIVDGRELLLVSVILLGEVHERIAILHDMPATAYRLGVRWLAVCRLTLPRPTGRVARRQVHARQVLAEEKHGDRRAFLPQGLAGREPGAGQLGRLVVAGSGDRRPASERPNGRRSPACRAKWRYAHEPRPKVLRRQGAVLDHLQCQPRTCPRAGPPYARHRPRHPRLADEEVIK